MNGEKETKLQFFERMYSKTYRLVYYIINRIVYDEQASEDLTQDTYVSAYNNLDSLESLDEVSFKTWVGVIASNKAKDYVKKKRPQLFTDVGDFEYEYDPADDRIDVLPDAMAHKDELSKIVEKIMAGLPEDQRLIVMMFYFQQLSIREIASTTELNENTIKSKLNYAKQKIKLAFEEGIAKDYKLRSFAPLALFQIGLLGFNSTSTSPIVPFAAIAQSNQVKKETKKRKKQTNAARVVGYISVASGIIITAIGGGHVPLEQPGNETSPIESIEESVDVFDYLSLEFHGKNGSGVATLKYRETSDEAIRKIINTAKIVNASETLSNNQLVLVQVTLNDNTLDVSQTEKYYLVQGLD